MLYLRTSGVQSLPTVVFLHGIGTSGWMWESLVHRLDGLHCIAIDMPGHGKSRSIPWVSMEDTADRVGTIVKSHARNGTAHIVGLSLGAYVGLTLLSRHSDLIERCMLSGLNILPLPHPWLMNVMAYAMAPMLKTSFGANANARALKIPEDQRPGYRHSLKELSLRSFIAANQDAIAFSAPQALELVPNPTLLIAGENEHPLVHKSMAALADVLPHAQQRWAKGCGHGWSGERPDLFAATVSAWCREHQIPAELMTRHPQ
jgi:pimeloyl-ACP methyl ester carboxylesterase